MPVSDTPVADVSPDRISTFSAFASLGVLSITQDLTHAVLRSIGDMDGTNPELVAEETLCLVATTTARAAEVGLQAEPAHVGPISKALLNLPFTYRDYLIGHAMVAQNDPELSGAAEEVRSRLSRKQEFYTTHFPQGQFPGPHAMKDKMELWMGRVSPPKLPESPQERLASLGLVEDLQAHAKLVLAYGRRGAIPGE